MPKKDKKSYEEAYYVKDDTQAMNDEYQDDDTDNDNSSEWINHENAGNTNRDEWVQHNDRDHKRRKQRHTHEFLGSTRLAEIEEDPHNHRFAGVTGEAIPHGRSHYHRLETNTDFFDHFHEIENRTGLAIPVANGKHVHLVKGMTSFNDGHRHSFIFATLIQSPLV